MKKLLISYGVIFGKAIRAPRGYQMNDPAEHSGGTDPRKTG
jgi:hypothetical protein